MDVEEADIAAGNNNSSSVGRDSDGNDRLGRPSSHNQKEDDNVSTAESESEPADAECCGVEHNDVNPCRERKGEGPAQESDYGDHSHTNSRASQDDPGAQIRVEAGHEDEGNEIDTGIDHEEDICDEAADDVYHSEEESGCNEAKSAGDFEIPPRISVDSQHREVADNKPLDDRLRTADTDETAPLVQRPKSNSDRRRSSSVNSMESSRVFSVYLSDHFSDEDEMERGIPGQSSRVGLVGQEYDNDSGSFYIETPKERRIKYAKAAVLVTVVWVVMVSGVSIILSIDIWGVSDRFDRSDDEDLCILCGNHTLDFDFNSTSSDSTWPSLPTSDTATVVRRTLKPPPDNLPTLCSPTMFLGTGNAFGKIETCVQKCLPAACCLFHDKQAVLELVGTLGLTGDLEQQAYLYLSNVKDCSNEVDTCQAYSSWCASLYGGLDTVLETSLPAYFERNCDKSKSRSPVDGCAEDCVSVECCYQEQDTEFLATAVMRKRTRQHAGGVHVSRKLQGRQQCDHFNTNEERTKLICDAYSPYCHIEEPSVDPSQYPSAMPSFAPTSRPSGLPSASSLPSPQPSFVPSSSQQPTPYSAPITTVSNDTSIPSPMPMIPPSNQTDTILPSSSSGAPSNNRTNTSKRDSPT